MNYFRSLLVILGFCLLSLSVNGAETTKYPAPRFPSYLKPFKSIDDVMPYARAAVRQTGGRTPLGLVEKGTVLIVVEPAAEETVMQAIKRAYEERGVKVQLLPEHELAGVSKEEARKAKEATRDYTSEQGYMEAERWISSRFDDPEVPKKWLRERKPDLYIKRYSRKRAKRRKTCRLSPKSSRGRGSRKVS